MNSVTNCAQLVYLQLAQHVCDNTKLVKPMLGRAHVKPRMREVRLLSNDYQMP